MFPLENKKRAKCEICKKILMEFCEYCVCHKCSICKEDDCNVYFCNEECLKKY